MTDALDQRLHVWRDDLADIALRGRVEARDYVPGRSAQIATHAPLHERPDATAPMISEALPGELADVFETSGGWAWVQLRRDGYVGYMPEAHLSANLTLPSHRITAPTALVFPAPDIKAPPSARLPLGAEVAATPHDDAFLVLAGGGYVCHSQIGPLTQTLGDYINVAERFLGVPYLWGGKTAAGLDCSGLIQVALQAGGVRCPRDSDMQCSELAKAVEDTAEVSLFLRGDLLFWPGHVAIAVSNDILLHATAAFMETIVEPMPAALERMGSPSHIAANPQAVR